MGGHHTREPSRGETGDSLKGSHTSGTFDLQQVASMLTKVAAELNTAQVQFEYRQQLMLEAKE